jgi:hypothetical protein
MLPAQLNESKQLLPMRRHLLRFPTGSSPDTAQRFSAKGFRDTTSALGQPRRFWYAGVMSGFGVIFWKCRLSGLQQALARIPAPGRTSHEV